MKPIFLTSVVALALTAMAGQPLYAADNDKPSDGRRTNSIAARGQGNVRGNANANGNARAAVPRAPAPVTRAPVARQSAQSVRNPVASAGPSRTPSPRVNRRTTINPEPSPAQVQARSDVAVRRAEAERQTTAAQRSIAEQRAGAAEQTLRARQSATAERNAIVAQRNGVRAQVDANRRANAFAATRTFNNESRRDIDRRGWDDRRFDTWRHYQYFYAPDYAYRGWNHDRVYSWNHHRYHWYDGTWVLIDPGFDYDYGGGVYVENSGPTLAPIGANTVAQVQFELQRAGYDPGPADGVIGNHTRDAIAQYQADHGLAVTARIDGPLLASLGIQS